MARFCAILSPDDPAREVEHMGGSVVFVDGPCGLGVLPNERPGRGAGPYRARRIAGGPDLVAVGEVTLYNRAAIERELDGAGEPAPPGCDDAEVLLRFFDRAGVDGLARTTGMFALAVWDGESLWLLRDAVGARTLFYAKADGRQAAGSALRALRRWPRLPARVNLSAVRSFLTFAYLPGEETLLAGVSELLPGCALRLRPDGSSALQRYWEPREVAPDPALTPGDYAIWLRQLLEEATSMRLPRGEDVGVFLSGGLDSSLVTAIAARLHDRPLRTYAISFGDDLPNELAYSELVAAHCGTLHRSLSFTGTQIADHLADAVGRLDCPVGDPLTVPNLLLARTAADDGLRVVLNGEGGDPCFGGPKNIPMFLFELHRTDSAPEARANAYLRAYRKCYDDLPHLLSPAALAALDDAPSLERLVLPYFEDDRMRSYLNRLLHANLRTKGAHHILTKVERLTSSCGIEGRAPLFDRAVIECAFAIPPELKLSATTEKWILKQAVRDLLPATIVDRPKSGMRVPVQHWLDGPLKRLADDLLLGRRARARGLFQPEMIEEWVRGKGSFWQRQGGKLWLVLTLELWLRAFVDRQDT